MEEEKRSNKKIEVESKMEEEKRSNKKQNLLLVLGLIAFIGLVGGVTYAFFNYTRTGAGNTIRVGRIAFISRQTETISLTNLFPIDPTETGVMDNEEKVGTLEIEIEGDTDYVDGVEYLISTVNSSITSNGKTLPISLDVTVTNLGTSSDSYFTARESKNATIYKKLIGDTLTGDEQVLVGYIKPNTTSGTKEGVNGKITIKAYLDKSNILISDTYNDGEEPTDNMGTLVSMGEGKTVFTTTEWNVLQQNGVSFQIKVEANEGIWVEGGENLADKVKSRLGQDGVVAVNSEGDLYTGSGTIREYRYSGIGNYCTYTDGTNNYNISVEGTSCPEHSYLMAGPDGNAVIIGSSDGITASGVDGSTELNRVNATPTDSLLKNYVMFNNEKWRIVGVFGNNVKIVKDLPLTSNVTTNEVDLDTNNDANELYTNTLNEKYHLKYLAFPTTLKYGYFMYNWPQDDSNYTYNWNDWTHSGLMYYLNETNTGSYYNTISSNYRNLIDTTTYYLGNVSINNSTNMIDGTAKQIYTQERGNLVCDSSVMDWSQNNDCNVWNGNSATWSGKVALLYPSDYAYASNTSNWTKNVGAYYSNGGSLNNWLFNTDAAYNWFLSPASYGSSDGLRWDGVGFVGNDFVNDGVAARPVLNLVSTAETIEGDGSYSNPYILNVE